MGCGCHQKNIDYASNVEQYKKAVNAAKIMSVDEGAWYCVVRRNNGKYDFVPESHYVADNECPFVEYISPFPFYFAT